MQLPSPHLSEEQRLLMTASCGDCDYIPKVPTAGMIIRNNNGDRVQVMHNGLQIAPDCYYGAWMTELIRRLRGHHEPQEEAVFHEVIKILPRNATMLELGGFWSYYTLWFLMRQPERKAVVLEPDPNHLLVGRENARLNELNPHFIHGLAGKCFEDRITYKTESAGEVLIPRYSVNDILREKKWSSLSLLHIDIQGAEVEILESCTSLFCSRVIDWVFVSTHSHWISGDPLTHQRCLEILREVGAVVEIEHDVHESFSGDGLIVARFCHTPIDWHPPELSYNRQSSSFFRHLAFDLADKMNPKSSQSPAETGPGEVTHRDLKVRGQLVQLTAPGALGEVDDTLLFFDDNAIGWQCRVKAEWDIQSVRRFSSHIKSGRRYTLVDVGANIGLFSRQLVKLTDSVEKIICVEPDRDNFRVLKYNMSSIGIQADLQNYALSRSNGVGKLLRDLENTGNYSLNKDAMRNRPFNEANVETRSTFEWASKNLSGAEAILWKSDTQGFDELIVSLMPMDVWMRVNVALLEMWRIEKPEYDREEFRAKLADFPYRQLGDEENVSVDDILDYLRGNDWAFKDLLLWREPDWEPPDTKRVHTLWKWLEHLIR